MVASLPLHLLGMDTVQSRAHRFLPLGVQVLCVFLTNLDEQPALNAGVLAAACGSRHVRNTEG